MLQKKFSPILSLLIISASGLSFFLSGCGKGWDFSDRKIFSGNWAISTISFEDAATNMDSLQIHPDSGWDKGRWENHIFIPAEGEHGLWALDPARNLFTTVERDTMTNRMFYRIIEEDRIILQQRESTNRFLFLLRRN